MSTPQEDPPKIDTAACEAGNTSHIYFHREDGNTLITMEHYLGVTATPSTKKYSWWRTVRVLNVLLVFPFFIILSNIVLLCAWVCEPFTDNNITAVVWGKKAPEDPKEE